MLPPDRLRSAVVDRLAAQWIALGGQLAGAADPTIIDLEALVAVTAEIGGADPRIHEVGLDWCVAYGDAINVARLRAVAAEIGIGTGSLGAFAGLVAAAGGPRWPMATEPRTSYRSRGNALVRDLRDPARLVWRLRAAFGVNARADVVAALRPQPDAPFSVAELARRLRFTKRNVALAVAWLRLAGLVETERVGNGDHVRLARDPALLAWLGPVPAGASLDWTSRWAVALGALRRLEKMQSEPAIVQAVEARAFVERVRPALRRAGLPDPDLAIQGTSFTDAFTAWTAALAADLATEGPARDAASDPGDAEAGGQS